MREALAAAAESLTDSPKFTPNRRFHALRLVFPDTAAFHVGVENKGLLPHCERMKRCFIAWLLAAVLAGGCKPSDAPVAAPASGQLALPTEAQPRLPTIKLYLGAEEMITEIARTEQQQECGMMFRTNMPENEGMIFLLPYPMRASFWMKNCPLPLSAAYIDANGTIVEIHALQPQDTNSVVAGAYNIQYVLETPQGWFARHNITTGAAITTEKGPLKQVFGN